LGDKAYIQRTFSVHSTELFNQKKIMTKLFKAVDPAKKKSIEKRIYFSTDESIRIKHLARIRRLTTANFLMRAALGKRAPIHPYGEAVGAFSQFGNALRRFHASFDLENHLAAEKVIVDLHTAARDAILKIGNNPKTAIQCDQYPPMSNYLSCNFLN